ncbi:MAG: hypothetical protein IKY90_04275 [Oscillospiraceae bacterium]|nr:hypothetical protein [Oscillospiraceae bacterium]
MATNWTDRVPTYPNRYKVTKADGSFEYITLERADEPTVEGTPINAANLKAIMFGGNNVITSATNDTIERWLSLGTGIYYFSLENVLTGQPNRYGYVLNIAEGSNVRQMFFALPTGKIYHRGGNHNGWSLAWTSIADVSDITASQVGLGNVTNNKQMPIAGGTFTGNAIAYETARTTRGIFNEETRESDTTGTLQSVKYFINVI